MLRLFAGIALPPELKLRLSHLASGVPGARWVDPGNYHVTLRFIGDVDEGTASDIDAALARLRATRFTLTLAGVDAFGSHSLYVGVAPEPVLMNLQAKIEQALIRLGLAPEGRKYSPHVTLARLKGRPKAKLAAYLAQHALFRAAPFDVTQFTLVASYLTKSGSIYEDQAEYALGGAAGLKR